MEKMKQPTPLWQVVSMFITVALFALGGIVSMNNKVSKLEEAIINIQMKQTAVDAANDKKFDKLDQKIDLIQIDTRQILINMEKKMDRK